MIGVILREKEKDSAREFFELFKTPWESYQADRRYSMVITTEEMPAQGSSPAVVIFNSQPVAADRELGVITRPVPKSAWIECGHDRFPVYGNLSAVECDGQTMASVSRRGDAVVSAIARPGLHVTRIGFDLFQEVAFLLSQGQPAVNAEVPTMELHVALLRAILLNAGIAFVEVPPVPAGYLFMACLTHDVDFRGICDHKLDQTMWGFLYRGLFGSQARLLKKRMKWSKFWTNIKAVASLPFVYAGVKPDFWLEFDRYASLEQGLGSTFYFVPFQNHPGTSSRRSAPKRRAIKYDLNSVKDEVRQLLKSGCEVGVHGIDAWQDAAKGLLERRRIQEITGQNETGARMHWLYFDADTPKALKHAGFAYDSTFGYNEAIGFRAGTSQVFSPCGPEGVPELPLNIQDTAMFYPDRMDMQEAEALERCRELIRSMCRFGGALTINWHTRSLSPERLWGDFYSALLDAIRERSAWFATAGTLVNWFRHRRSLRFEDIQFGPDGVTVHLSGVTDLSMPPFLVRVYHPALQPEKLDLGAGAPSFIEKPWTGKELMISLQAISCPA